MFEHQLVTDTDNAPVAGREAHDLPVHVDSSAVDLPRMAHTPSLLQALRAPVGTPVANFAIRSARDYGM